MQSFHYIILLSFRILKVLKVKYNLSVNCSLVLHGCYVYSRLIKEGFTKTAIMKFVTYFDYNKIIVYFNVLLKRGFIVDSGKTYAGRTLYNVSDQVTGIVKEIEESYNKELYLFAEKYNIEL